MKPCASIQSSSSVFLCLALVACAADLGDPGSEETGEEMAATCAGVAVKPGDNIQALLNAQPAGTTLCFAAGTYNITSTLRNPRPVTLDLRAGAILDGGNGGFTGIGSGPGLTIRGGVFQHFGNSGSPGYTSPLIL